METPSFQSLFCERFGCLSNQYENRAFYELLYGHAKIVAAALRRLKPDFFAEDLKFIRYLGQATDLREANASTADFQDSNAARRNFGRSRLKIRVSGRKATELAHQLFARPRPLAPPGS
jgi:hypothetical protein